MVVVVHRAKTRTSEPHFIESNREPEARTCQYKHSYMEEYVSIPKLIASLRLLLKIRHPEYRFLTEEMIQDYEARLQKEADSEDKE